MRSRVAGTKKCAQVTGGLSSQAAGLWDRRVVQGQGGPFNWYRLSLPALEEEPGCGVREWSLATTGP